MLEKWKKKSLFGKISDVFFILFIIAMLTPQGRLSIGGLLNRVAAKVRKPSQIEDGKLLLSSDYNWQLQKLNGELINLQDFKNKVLFINEWATWCPPCVGEMPEIQNLYEQFKDNPKIKFLIISNEELPKIQQFIEKRNYTFPVYSSRSNAPQIFQSRSIPTTFLISKKAKMVIKETGAKNWSGSKMIAIVNKLLEE